MKVLSIKEPYCSLIAYKNKRIETRSWGTNYRGPIYLHASASRIPKEYRENKELMELASDIDMHYGCIICKAQLVDCVKMDEEFIEKVKANHDEYAAGFYNAGRYAWILEDVQVVKPLKAKGHLGIWNLDTEYKIWPEYLDLFGPDVDDDYVLSIEELLDLATGWDVSTEEVLEGVYEI